MPDKVDPSFATPQEKTQGTEKQGTAGFGGDNTKSPAPAKKAAPKKAAPKGDSKKPKGKKKDAKDPDKDKLSPREIEREYGFAYQFFKSDDELWDLLQKAIKGNWSSERFQARLQDTKWFQKHSDIWRQNTALKYTDPSTYRERLNNYKDQIQNLAGQWGADLTQRELNTYAERAYLFGWSEAQILDHIAKDVTPNKAGNYGGSLASIEQQLRQVAANNGIKIPQEQLTKWMRQIVRGNADVRQFETHIRDLAARTFEAYGQEIRSGMDALDIAAPYIQSMSEVLELNPANVNLFDRTIRSALSYRDPKTGEARPMSLTDFEDALRHDRRWQYTDNARETLKGYAIELGKMWGVLS